MNECQDRGLNFAEASELVNEVAFPRSEEDEARLESQYADPGDKIPPYRQQD